MPRADRKSASPKRAAARRATAASRPDDRRAPADAAATGRTHAARRDEAERRLLAAAVRIVADRGIEGMTLTEVGEAAGYSRGLPAHYFGRKHDLVAAVASYIADGFATRLARTSNRPPGMASLLHSVASYLDRSAPDDAAPTRALMIALAEALTEPVLAEPMSGVTQRSVGRLRAMIRQGIERGEIRRDVDPHAQAVIILGTLRTTIAHWVIDPEHVDLVTLRDCYVSSLQRSLAA